MIVTDDFLRVGDLEAAFDAADETFCKRSTIVLAAALEFSHGVDRLVIVPKVVSRGTISEDQGDQEAYA